MYSSTLSLTSALDVGRWFTPRPCCFNPSNDLLPVVLVAALAPGSVWTVAENLVPTGIRW